MALNMDDKSNGFFEIAPELKHSEDELVDASMRGDIAECRRLVESAGLTWNTTWDPASD